MNSLTYHVGKFINDSDLDSPQAAQAHREYELSKYSSEDLKDELGRREKPMIPKGANMTDITIGVYNYADRHRFLVLEATAQSATDIEEIKEEDQFVGALIRRTISELKKKELLKSGLWTKELPPSISKDEIVLVDTPEQHDVCKHNMEMGYCPVEGCAGSY